MERRRSRSTPSSASAAASARSGRSCSASRSAGGRAGIPATGSRRACDCLRYRCACSAASDRRCGRAVPARPQRTSRDRRRPADRGPVAVGKLFNDEAAQRLLILSLAVAPSVAAGLGNVRQVHGVTVSFEGSKGGPQAAATAMRLDPIAKLRAPLLHRTRASARSPRHAAIRLASSRILLTRYV